MSLDLAELLELIRKHGSVRRAAQSLGVSPEAISKRFRGLSSDDPLKIVYDQLPRNKKPRTKPQKPKVEPAPYISTEELLKMIEAQGTVLEVAKLTGLSHQAIHRRFNRLPDDDPIKQAYLAAKGKPWGW